MFASELVHSDSPAKLRKSQIELPFDKGVLSDEDVDSTWTLDFFGLDMVVNNKISHPLFRTTIIETKNTKTSKCMFPFIFLCCTIITLTCVEDTKSVVAAETLWTCPNASVVMQNMLMNKNISGEQQPTGFW